MSQAAGPQEELYNPYAFLGFIDKPSMNEGFGASGHISSSVEFDHQPRGDDGSQGIAPSTQSPTFDSDYCSLISPISSAGTSSATTYNHDPSPASAYHGGDFPVPNWPTQNYSTTARSGKPMGLRQTPQGGRTNALARSVDVTTSGLSPSERAFRHSRRVGSDKVRAESRSRRKRASIGRRLFRCPVDGCGAELTSKQNLQSEQYTHLLFPTIRLLR
ncbi:hypothetical protein AAF712_005155 [Marasmius tenuissimus]|uniref:Uncharacterized protein n=1 Tax=Marasmius tenuissimus TaxID=585030 RepID=A0ABR3A2L1_9AGAR